MENDRNKGFEEVEHTADNALRIHGHSMEELLRNAAHGMNSLMLNHVSIISNQIQKYVEVEAMDAESLLVEWLAELAYWAETHMLVFNRFEIETVTPARVRATLFGGKVSKLQKHIKAVTYHNLKIIETDKGLEATVVFDV
jgi:SHS2 domain-containing protein